MNIVFPDYIIKIIKKIEAEGKEAFAVGGCIRDTLLDRQPKDWDITTNAYPHEIKSIFSSPPYRIISGFGEKYGSVMISLYQNEKKYTVEITTYRTEGTYTENRYPTEVKYTSSLEEDLERRDFTINAIAACPSENGAKIIDPQNGICDIEKRILRTVGNAKKRFEEDALRIMRFIRFSSVLGFSTDIETEKYAKESAQLIKKISPERTASELEGFFKGDFYYDTAIKFFDILKTIIPEAEKSDIVKDKHPDVRFAFLFPDADSCIYRMKKMHFSSAYIKIISSLAELKKAEAYPNSEYATYILRQFENRSYEAVAFLSHIYGNEFSKKLFGYINDIVMNKKCFKISHLDINGNDLIKIGISGKEIGDTLSFLLEAVINEKVINRRENLIKYINISNYH